MKKTFRYKKEMGQNFIFDPALIEALADASGVTRADGVLEIGPGRGTLTAALARRARKVITVELDRTLIHDLEVAMALYPNVEIVEGDILRQNLPALAARLGEPCRVAANLPYNITTPVIEALLCAKLPFSSIAIMVQKEVGERMLAQAGMPGYGPFSLLIRYFTQPSLALDVPAECFTPRPKVDSSFMLLAARETPVIAVSDEALFFRVIRVSFAMRRKTILNNLMSGFSISRSDADALLAECHIPINARAEQLDMDAFGALSDAIFRMRK